DRVVRRVRGREDPHHAGVRRRGRTAAQPGGHHPGADPGDDAPRRRDHRADRCVRHRPVQQPRHGRGVPAAGRGAARRVLRPVDRCQPRRRRHARPPPRPGTARRHRAGRQRPEVPDRGPVRLNPRPGIDVTIDNGGRRSGGTRVGRRWIVAVRIRSRWLRPVAVGAGAVALAAGTALVATAGGYPADRPNLLSGAAWLASAQVGRVTLLDGSAAEVAAEKTVAAPNDKIDVVQQGSTAYVVNRSTGSLRRVDGATFDVGAAVRPIPDAADGLLAFAGPHGLNALDAKRGLLAATDPQTLAATGG